MVSCNSSLSVFLNHYRTLRTKERRGSKASGFWKRRRKTNKLTFDDTAGVAAAIVATSCVFIFHELPILRLSEIRPIRWFLTEGELEVLVDPSARTNLNNEPETNGRDYLSCLIVLQKLCTDLAFVNHLLCTGQFRTSSLCLKATYVLILLFVHHLVCKGHFRTSNVPPYSTASLGWMHEYPENTFA